MGRNNQQRRAAKKRRKQRSGSGRPPHGSGRGPSAGSRGPSGPGTGGGPRRTAPADVEELLHVAVVSWQADPPRFTAALDALVEQMDTAAALADARLEGAVTRLWTQGWMPSDVVHVVARQLTAGHVEVAAQQLVTDGRRRVDGGERRHPRWHSQLAELEERERTPGLPLPDKRLRHVVELLCLYVRLPDVPTTVPPPGRNGTGPSVGEARLDGRMLARVRALLAKAESTTFDDEAEAFTAKAQELISRHAIDEALLHRADTVGEPSVRRILIDDPYADAKANLLAEVAGANRCRVVYSADLAWVTVFGYDRDLDAVELLAASLLTQATRAMVRHGSRRDAAGRSRTRSFRRAFLLGFAQRIGERLRQATEAQVSATDDRSAQLVPVLAARDDRIQAAQQEAFPELVHRSVSVSNATGWSAGMAAAQLADLGVSPHRLPDA